MARNKIIVDTETGGLDPLTDELIEVAFCAADDPKGEIVTLILPHDPDNVGAEAAKVNGYYERGLNDPAKWASESTQRLFFGCLSGATLVGANVGFDAAFLRHYAQAKGLPHDWHYRMLDIESMGYAMGEFEDVPGLIGVWQWFQNIHDELGLPEIPKPDHTAEGDVRTVWALLQLLPRAFGKDRDVPTVEQAMGEATA